MFRSRDDSIHAVYLAVTAVKVGKSIVGASRENTVTIKLGSVL